MMVMKLAVWLLLATPMVWAEHDAKDVIAVDRAIASLNYTKTRSATDEVWSEMSRPRIVTRSVQFLSKTLVRVDAARVQYGSVMNRSTPVVVMLERQGATWKIKSVTDAFASELPTMQPVRFLPQ